MPSPTTESPRPKLFIAIDPNRYPPHDFVCDPLEHSQDSACDTDLADGTDRPTAHQGLWGPLSWAPPAPTWCLTKEEAAQAVTAEREVDATELWVRSSLYAAWAAAKWQLLEGSGAVLREGSAAAVVCAAEDARQVLAAFAEEVSGGGGGGGGGAAAAAVATGATTAEARLCRVTAAVGAAVQEGEAEMDVMGLIEAVERETSHAFRWLRGLVWARYDAFFADVKLRHELGCHGVDDDCGMLLPPEALWAALGGVGVAVPAGGLREALEIRYRLYHGRTRMFRAGAFLSAMRCPVGVSDFWACRSMIGAVTHARLRDVLAEGMLLPERAAALLQAGDDGDAEEGLRRLRDACGVLDEQQCGHISVDAFLNAVKASYGVQLPDYWAEVASYVYNTGPTRRRVAYAALLDGVAANELLAAPVDADPSALPAQPSEGASLVGVLHRKWMNRGRPVLVRSGGGGHSVLVTPKELQDVLRRRLGLHLEEPLLTVACLQFAESSGLLGVARSMSTARLGQAGNPKDLRSAALQPQPLLASLSRLQETLEALSGGRAP